MLVATSLLILAVAALRIAPNLSSLLSAEQQSQHQDPNFDLSVLAASASVGPAPRAPRVVYPYSVIPGGIQSAEELREVSEHDPAIGALYAGFDYRNAKIIELSEPELVYVSYRLKSGIFWTKSKVRLHKGEKLVTDGKIIARARCANRVSEAAVLAVSPEEPPSEKFEEPMFLGGSAVQAPFPEMAYSPETPVLASAAPPPGGFPGVFPPVYPGPNPVCTPPPPGSNKPNPCPPHKHPPKPPVVPEPASIVLVSSGLFAIYLRTRKKN